MLQVFLMDYKIRNEMIWCRITDWTGNHWVLSAITNNEGYYYQRLLWQTHSKYHPDLVKWPLHPDGDYTQLSLFTSIGATESGRTSVLHIDAGPRGATNIYQTFMASSVEMPYITVLGIPYNTDSEAPRE